MTTTHTPSRPQRRHAPSQALPQQTPSAQKPLAHSCPEAHVRPSALRHSPRASHIRPSVQLRGSTASTIAVQVPPPHRRQGPPQALSQQTPSTQNPLAQAPPSSQRCPRAARQPPRPSQALPPLQPPPGRSSIAPAGSGSQPPVAVAQR